MPLFIVHVFIHVKHDMVEDFSSATLENAQHSMQEPGVCRFDVVQQQDDATRFVLVEVYKSREAAVSHKETAHYNKWRETVQDMMAEPRYSIRYTNVFPNNEEWS